MTYDRWGGSCDCRDERGWVGVDEQRLWLPRLCRRVPADMELVGEDDARPAGELSSGA